MIGTESAVEIVWWKELRENPDCLNPLAEGYKKRFLKPHLAAERRYIDEPSKRLVMALDALSEKRRTIISGIEIFRYESYMRLEFGGSMKYSFVIPCYRSEHTIEQVVAELISEIEQERLKEYEIILVNDCSPDNVWPVIKQLAEQYPFVHGISLARNFGQHAALMAGYAKTIGDVVVSLDDDGQAPIDELYKLFAELDRGKDVVYAYYREIKQNRFRRFGSYVAELMGRFLLGWPKSLKGSSFYAARRFVIEEMLHYDNAYPYLPGLVLRVTKNIGCVETEHRKRMEGRSGYSFRKLFSLWLNGFTAFSIKPLEIGVWVGVLFAAAGLLGTVITIAGKICHPEIAAGWSSTISLLLVIGGAVMLMLGLIGEYVGRIYICINKAPQYVIREDTFSLESEEVKT